LRQIIQQRILRQLRRNQKATASDHAWQQQQQQQQQQQIPLPFMIEFGS
jgi:hypothetical protein